jgi:hypothetical protein
MEHIKERSYFPQSVIVLVSRVSLIPIDARVQKSQKHEQIYCISSFHYSLHQQLDDIHEEEKKDCNQ